MDWSWRRALRDGWMGVSEKNGDVFSGCCVIPMNVVQNTTVPPTADRKHNEIAEELCREESSQNLRLVDHPVACFSSSLWLTHCSNLK